MTGEQKVWAIAIIAGAMVILGMWYAVASIDSRSPTPHEICGDIDVTEKAIACFESIEKE